MSRERELQNSLKSLHNVNKNLKRKLQIIGGPRDTYKERGQISRLLKEGDQAVVALSIGSTRDSNASLFRLSLSLSLSRYIFHQNHPFHRAIQKLRRQADATQREYENTKGEIEIKQRQYDPEGGAFRTKEHSQSPSNILSPLSEKNRP